MLSEFYSLEKRVTELEETVRLLLLHVRNMQQTNRYHDEALTVLFDRADEPKTLRKIAEAKPEYKT